MTDPGVLDLLSLAMKRTALRWMRSILLISCFWYGSQMMAPYFRRGRGGGGDQGEVGSLLAGSWAWTEIPSNESKGAVCLLGDVVDVLVPGEAVGE